MLSGCAIIQDLNCQQTAAQVTSTVRRLIV